MTNTRRNGRSKQPPTTSHAVRTRLLQVAAFAAIQAAILFGAAGRLDWPMAWATLGVYLGTIAAISPVLLRTQPDLIAERAAIREGARGWDVLVGTLSGSVSPLVMLLIAGLDRRFGWSPPLPLAGQLIALLITSLGYDLFAWAMASNRFFSAVVRIQREHGHTVVSGGPYRYVRHPGYAGMLLYSLAAPVALGSFWALIPAALTACLVVVRTVLEERTLQAELDGYDAYAARVRYRLLPGIW